MLFPKPYESKGLCVSYKGRDIQLEPYQEEISIYWVQSFGSEFHNNPFYKKNFSEAFLKSFGKRMELFQLSDGEVLNFDDIDFSSIAKHLEERKKL